MADLADTLEAGLRDGVINAAERDLLLSTEGAREAAIRVDAHA